MTEYERPYDPTWRDSGETCEICPVPFCGKKVLDRNLNAMIYSLRRSSGCED